MQEALNIRDLELNALLEVTQAINNNLSEEDLYRIYRFTVLGDLQVKKMLLYVKDDEWTCKVNFGDSDKKNPPELSLEYQSLEEAVLIESVDEFGGFDIAFPVKHKKKILAVVFVGGVKEEQAVDTTFLRALTNILIVAIENKKLARQQLQQEAYRKELEIAKKVQNFLFPKTLPQGNNLKIEAVYLPHHEVGGDYYDYIKLSDNKFLICIADVSGKGVPAALLMSNFQASLRALVRKTHNLKEIVTELNHATFTSGNGENFITVFVGIYDFKRKSFDYVNCGHNPTYLKSDGSVQKLVDGTTILGMFDPLPFLSTGRVTALDQFVFFGYTDGLTETFNAEGDPYGEQNLEKILSGSFSSLSELHAEIFKSLDEFRNEYPYGDDITIISCEVNS
ncbi:MAG: GAF domain-containing SpoIIE family protein phosphatase [Cyclobacteriaceae bacterium]